MKIFDCFMFFDEDQILDLRLNVLNKYIDYFVIVESTYNHRGEKRNLIFNEKKYKNFRDKIIYLVYDKIPESVKEVKKKDNKRTKDVKYIMNALYRENSQRNFILEGLKDAEDNDMVLISDVDEIPKLNIETLKNVKNEILIFKQDMFYYKFNLSLPNFKWPGTKGVKKKNLISPQWLRNVKHKKYPFYRLDTFFSKKKYTNLEIIEDGGWHFSNIKSPKMIEHKLKSYLHHREFDLVSLTEKEIQNLVNKKQAIYDLRVDKRVNKVGNGVILEKFNTEKLPNYIQINLSKYKEWMD
ncbi:hypothetical protein [Candidatus Pelagibacter sp. FZCC0015]|uniref:hypothetical protein n=1 Tax=Candidatus Pelagibacter sp. FZCC0015 TaxID=2268451 RepID=UPI0011A531C8|nr:hypothetical protein [Candidatus Pelagibacter sp. FZCC0015]